MKTRKYTYAMSVLYQTLRIVLMNCRNNLPAFMLFNKFYSADFITELEAELEVAERMKSDQARMAEHEFIRTEMLPIAQQCRSKWQYLKCYISDAFGVESEVTFWDAAGWQYYEDSVKSWDKLREMCSMASVFIDANSAKLIDVGGMPDDFKDVFNELVAAFNAKYNAFLLAQENAMQGTADKIDSNNSIFEKVSKICWHGQTIFMDNDVKKSLFSMQAVSELVKPVGAAGLKGVVTKDGKAQAGLIVELENESLHVITDADGSFDFGNRLASGKDTLIIRDGDEILAEEAVVINPGVTKRENVILPVPVVAHVETTTPTAPTA